ncbi:MAG: hypothetical protein LAO51_12420 [Acidobacteriia bacterium]|nr:hypothetical protein [Terriglobia bacterium]
MSQGTSTPSSVPTWSDIFKTSQSKTKEDLTSEVAPAVNSGRLTLGCLLVSLGQKLQPKQ